IYRQCGFQTGERFADDPGKESRGRLVRLARPHHDAGQPDAYPLAKPAPRVIGEQRLADRLLRAIRGERREMKLVGYRRWKRCPEHGDRGGIDEPWPVTVADCSNRLEQGAHAVEIDVIAFVEVELGFTRNDAGEMEYGLWAICDRLYRLSGSGQIGS